MLNVPRLLRPQPHREIPYCEYARKYGTHNVLENFQRRDNTSRNN